MFTRPPRRVFWMWGALAVANLGIGILIAMVPSRAIDFEGVWRWTRQWAVEGVNIYAVDDGSDYPPHAIVLLAPLGLIPFDLAVPIWALLNLVLACLAPHLAARFIRPGIPFSAMLLPTLMFLTWGGVRTLLQFSLLALTCGMAALALAERRPIWSGIFLGLATIKPHVALPMFLWAIFARRLRIAGVAMATVTVGLVVFCLRAAADPVDVMRRHLAFLGGVVSGENRRVGLSEVRPLIEAVLPQGPASDLVAAALALSLLAFICGAGLQEGKLRTTSIFAAPPLAAFWVLLTFYHLTYGFILLLPAMMLLAGGELQSSRLRRRLFWTMQAGLMLDVPGVWRMSGLSGSGVVSAVFANFDRGLFLALFVGFVVLSRRG
jgi:hypothetical protein